MSESSSKAQWIAALLLRLRSERGMSRRELQDRSGVSETTIYRAESTGSAPWRAETTLRLLAALHARMYVQNNDAATLLAHLGFGELATTARERGLDSLIGTEERATDPKPPTEDEARAHLWLQQLMERTSASAVSATLRCIAAIAGIDLIETSQVATASNSNLGTLEADPGIVKFQPQPGITIMQSADPKKHRPPEVPAARDVAKKKKAQG
jgi:DNA-binding phage protein